MVNEEKVHIMTQIALDETKKCKDQLHEGGYYKSDYIRSHTISAVRNITVSYLLVLFLIALYFSDYLFVNVVRLNYLQLGIMIGGGYFILLTGTVFFSYFYYLKQYTVSQDLVRSYLEHIEVLGAFYQQNENGEENGDDTSISS